MTASRRIELHILHSVREPEMEFLDMNLTKDLRLLLHAIHSLYTTGVFYWKPYSTLVLITPRKKIHETRKLESFHELQFGEQKNEGRKPDKNSSLRRLKFMPRWKLPFKNSISGFFESSMTLRVRNVPRKCRERRVHYYAQEYIKKPLIKGTLYV
jgi:hypothetical protein